LIPAFNPWVEGAAGRRRNQELAQDNQRLRHQLAQALGQLRAPGIRPVPGQRPTIKGKLLSGNNQPPPTTTIRRSADSSKTLSPTSPPRSGHRMKKRLKITFDFTTPSARPGKMPPLWNCSAALVEESWSWHACCVVPRVSSPVLVGRSGELSALDTALAEAGRGSPSTVIVEGEAGVGKSRLVSEFAGRSRGAGTRVLAGGCLELGADGLACDGQRIPSPG
jgi:hypothetical protein